MPVLTQRQNLFTLLLSFVSVCLFITYYVGWEVTSTWVEENYVSISGCVHSLLNWLLTGSWSSCVLAGNGCYPTPSSTFARWSCFLKDVYHIFSLVCGNVYDSVHGYLGEIKYRQHLDWVITTASENLTKQILPWAYSHTSLCLQWIIDTVSMVVLGLRSYLNEAMKLVSTDIVESKAWLDTFVNSTDLS